MKENRPLHLRHLAWFPVGWAMGCCVLGVMVPGWSQPCLVAVFLFLFVAFVLSFMLE